MFVLPIFHAILTVTSVLKELTKCKTVTVPFAMATVQPVQLMHAYPASRDFILMIMVSAQLVMLHARFVMAQNTVIYVQLDT